MDHFYILERFEQNSTQQRAEKDCCSLQEADTSETTKKSSALVYGKVLRQEALYKGEAGQRRKWDTGGGKRGRTCKNDIAAKPKKGLQIRGRLVPTVDIFATDWQTEEALRYLTPDLPFCFPYERTSTSSVAALVQIGPSVLPSISRWGSAGWKAAQHSLPLAVYAMRLLESRGFARVYCAQVVATVELTQGSVGHCARWRRGGLAAQSRHWAACEYSGTLASI